MTVTKISKADTGRELDLIRAGFSSDVQRELGSTMLVIRMDLTDFDRMVNLLGKSDREAREGAYERGYDDGHRGGWDGAIDAINSLVDEDQPA